MAGIASLLASRWKEKHEGLESYIYMLLYRWSDLAAIGFWLSLTTIHRIFLFEAININDLINLFSRSLCSALTWNCIATMPDLDNFRAFISTTFNPTLCFYCPFHIMLFRCKAPEINFWHTCGRSFTTIGYTMKYNWGGDLQKSLS